MLLCHGLAFHFLCLFSIKMSVFSHWFVKVIQSCLTLCNPMGYTVHGILQARILARVAYPFSSRSSQPRNQTGVSCIAGGLFTNWAIREALIYRSSLFILDTNFWSVRFKVVILMELVFKFILWFINFLIEKSFPTHVHKNILLYSLLMILCLLSIWILVFCVYKEGI